LAARFSIACGEENIGPPAASGGAAKHPALFRLASQLAKCIGIHQRLLVWQRSYWLAAAIISADQQKKALASPAAYQPSLLLAGWRPAAMAGEGGPRTLAKPSKVTKAAIHGWLALYRLPTPARIYITGGSAGAALVARKLA